MSLSRRPGDGMILLEHDHFVVILLLLISYILVIVGVVESGWCIAPDYDRMKKSDSNNYISHINTYVSTYISYIHIDFDTLIKSVGAFPQILTNSFYNHIHKHRPPITTASTWKSVISRFKKMYITSLFCPKNLVKLCIITLNSIDARNLNRMIPSNLKMQ